MDQDHTEVCTRGSNRSLLPHDDYNEDNSTNGQLTNDTTNSCSVSNNGVRLSNRIVDTYSGVGRSSTDGLSIFDIQYTEATIESKTCADGLDVLSTTSTSEFNLLSTSNTNESNVLSTSITDKTNAVDIFSSRVRYGYIDREDDERCREELEGLKKLRDLIDDVESKFIKGYMGHKIKLGQYPAKIAYAYIIYFIQN